MPIAILHVRHSKQKPVRLRFIYALQRIGREDLFYFMRHTLRIRLERIASNQWAQRGLLTLIRAAWLGLSVWCFGLGLHLLFDWPLDSRLLGIASLVCVAVGALLLLRPRTAPAIVARRLDRRFRLNEELATALEVGAHGNPQGVAANLLEHANRTLNQVNRTIAARRRFPIAEVITLASLALVVFGLLMMIGAIPLRLPPVAEPLPDIVSPPPIEETLPEPPAPQPNTPPEPGTQTGGGQVSGGNQAALAALADALRDDSLTRPAADALDQGDTAGAAQTLRELADQTDRISQAARDSIASSLREAARNVQNADPELADQLRSEADRLQQDAESAALALDDLASTVEQLGGAGQGAQFDAAAGQDRSDQSNGQGGGAGNSPPSEQRALERPADRLGIEGVPLELENEGAGDIAGNADNQTPVGGSGGVGGFEQGAQAPDSTRVQTGDDPLRIPMDLRNVVQEYFAP